MTSYSKDLNEIKRRASTSDLKKRAVLQTRMLKMNPNDPFTYFNLAAQLLRQKEYRKAKQKWKRSIQMSPGMAFFYIKWLNTLDIAREYEEVLLLKEKYPEKFTIVRDLESILGKCYLHLGDYDNAIQCFQEVKLTRKNYNPSFFNLAVVLYLKGKKEEAKKIIGDVDEHILKLYVSSHRREIQSLKGELTKETSKGIEDHINTQIEGFEYVLQLMSKKKEESGSE